MMYQANPNQSRIIYPPLNNQMQYNYSYSNYNNYSQNNNENNVNKKENFTIDKIREFPMKLIAIEREYDIIKEIGSGDYGKVILATHKRTNTQVALKAVPKITTPIKDFYFEFHYSYFLSPHQIILDTYDVAFETREFYYFAQEVAPLGDLWQAVERTDGVGLLERDAKIIIQQLTKALEFMHEKNLVHRDFGKNYILDTANTSNYPTRLGDILVMQWVIHPFEIRLEQNTKSNYFYFPENVLVFTPDFSKVKLTDFGLTRKAGTLVKKRTRSLPTCPPEIWYTIHLEGYHVELGSDVWQMAMFIFIITQARFPWEKADITDMRFNEFCEWQKRKTTKIPREFTRFSPRMMRLFRRLMEVKPDKRSPITEVNKYFKDQWLKPRILKKSNSGINPTMYPSNRQKTGLDVPQLSIKRESIGANMGSSQNFNMQHPVSRSLSCSQLHSNPYANPNLPSDQQLNYQQNRIQLMQPNPSSYILPP